MYVIDQAGKRHFVTSYHLEGAVIVIHGVLQRIILTFPSEMQAQTCLQILDQHASGSRGGLLLPSTATQQISWI